MKKVRKKASRGSAVRKSQSRSKTDHTTEEKIKEAARKVFTNKGYAAARTRDIAQEAGINLALLNYYFRSKEKLFEIIMMENIQQFAKGIREIFIDEKTSLSEKMRLMASYYVNMLMMHPDLPLFIMSELRSDPAKFTERLGVREFIFKSSYFRQMTEVTKGRGVKINPIHYFMNILGLLVFPFIASPILRTITEMKPDQFHMLMQERAELIPKWMDAMIKIK